MTLPLFRGKPGADPNLAQRFQKTREHNPPRPLVIVEPIAPVIGRPFVKTPAMRKQEREAQSELVRARELYQRTLEKNDAPPYILPNTVPIKTTSDGVLIGKSVPRLYEGRVAVVFATGPSLTQEVVDTIRPFHEDGTVVAIGCNDAYRAVPYLDVLYACDPQWWDKHVPQGVLNHPAVKWTQDGDCAKKYALNYIASDGVSDFSERQDLIHQGGNSGYQVMNLAFLYGVVLEILVGFNMGVPAGMRQHFFGNHPAGLNQSGSYNSFVPAFQTIRKRRHQVINCTPHSLLDMFTRRDLKEVLDECRSRRTMPDSTPASLEPAPV